MRKGSLRWSLRRVRFRLLHFCVGVRGALIGYEGRRFSIVLEDGSVRFIYSYLRRIFRCSGTFLAIVYVSLRASRVASVVLILFRFSDVFSYCGRAFSFVFFGVVSVVGALRFRGCGLLRGAGELGLGVRLFPSYVGSGVFRYLGAHDVVHYQRCLGFAARAVYKEGRSRLGGLFRS